MMQPQTTCLHNMADKNNRHHLLHDNDGGGSGGDVDEDDGALPTKRSSSLNKGAWTPEEDARLAKYIEIHGPRRWKSVAIKSGLNRCGKSCRLRWLNYLRPDIKRGDISEAEDDLILRLHRLLGNRWSLIARRLPGRTDNEIKNYWNAHLRKKAKLMEKLPATSTVALIKNWDEDNNDEEEDDDDDEEGEGEKTSSSMENASGNEMMMGMRAEASVGDGVSSSDVEGDEPFDFARQGTCGLEWVKSFLELEEDA